MRGRFGYSVAARHVLAATGADDLTFCAASKALIAQPYTLFPMHIARMESFSAKSYRELLASLASCGHSARNYRVGVTLIGFPIHFRLSHDECHAISKRAQAISSGADRPRCGKKIARGACAAAQTAIT
jgi:hypothetical protein